MGSYAKKTLWLIWNIYQASLGVVLVFVLWRLMQPAPEPASWTSLLLLQSTNQPPANVLDYKDLVSILLTALGVMIATGALFFAFAAIVGYHEGRGLIERIVTQRVDETLPMKSARAALDASSVAPTSSDANAIASSLDDDDADKQ